MKFQHGKLQYLALMAAINFFDVRADARAPA
jgi:hypothetical protein